MTGRHGWMGIRPSYGAPWARAIDDFKDFLAPAIFPLYKLVMANGVRHPRFVSPHGSDEPFEVVYDMRGIRDDAALDIRIAEWSSPICGAFLGYDRNDRRWAWAIADARVTVDSNRAFRLVRDVTDAGNFEMVPDRQAE
jgi:hypothetical protein